MSTEIKTAGRLVWLDLIKVLAAFMVCFYHLTEHNQVADFGHFEDGIYVPSFTKVLYGILSSCVPLFFIASGVVLRLKDRTWKQSLRGAFRLMLVAYVWGFVCNVMIRYISSGTFYVTLSDLISQPFYFWYLPTLAFIYLFDAFWLKIRHSRFTIVFFYLLLLFPFLSNLICVVLTYFNPAIQLPSWSHTGFFRLYSLVYVFLPYYWPSQLQRWKSLLFFVGGIGLVLLEVVSYSTAQGKLYDGVNASFPTIGALLIAYSLYSMCRLIPDRPWFSIFSWIGRNCLGIYILHYPMITFFNQYTSIQHSGWLFQFGAVASIILIAGIVSSGLRKLHLFI